MNRFLRSVYIETFKMFTIEMFEILSTRINLSICYELDVTPFRIDKVSLWHFFKVIEVLRPDVV